MDNEKFIPKNDEVIKEPEKAPEFIENVEENIQVTVSDTENQIEETIESVNEEVSENLGDASDVVSENLEGADNSALEGFENLALELGENVLDTENSQEAIDQSSKEINKGLIAKIVAIIAAIAIIFGGIYLFLPSLIPFNVGANITETKECVRVQETLLKGEDKDVLYINGKAYVSASKIAKVFNFGEQSGTKQTYEINGEKITLKRNINKVGKNKLENRIYANNNDLLVAFDDVPKVFATLRTGILSTERKVIYDPAPIVKTGHSLQEYCDMYIAYGYATSAEDFLEKIGMPADTDLSMDVNVFQLSQKIGQLAESSGKTLEEYIQGLGEEYGIDTQLINADSTVCDVQDQISCGKMFGVEGDDMTSIIEQTKMTKENLGFELKADTKFGEIRNWLYLDELDKESKQNEAQASEKENTADEPDLEAPAPEESSEATTEATAETTTDVVTKEQPSEEQAPQESVVEEQPAEEVPAK